MRLGEIRPQRDRRLAGCDCRIEPAARGQDEAQAGVRLRQVRRQAGRLSSISLRVVPSIDVCIRIAEVEASRRVARIVEQ
jgi:hypothetical protein